MSEKRKCVVCGKPLPKEGALREERSTGRIVPVHFECASSRLVRPIQFGRR